MWLLARSGGFMVYPTVTGSTQDFFSYGTNIDIIAALDKIFCLSSELLQMEIPDSPTC